MSAFKDVGVPIITAIIGGAVGSGLTFFWPKVWRVYEERYIDPKTALRQSLLETGEWYQDRASKLDLFYFELQNDPDAFKRQVLISKLDRQDREWAMKQTDIAILRRSAAEKAAECRDNASQNARWAEHVGDNVFFPL